MRINKKMGFQPNKTWKPGQQKGRQKRPNNKQSKLHIKFNEEDRRKYLTGFQKRKRERREKAANKIKEDLKAEMKQMRKDRAEIMKKLMDQGQKLAEGVDEIDKDGDDVMVSSCGSATVEIRGLDLTSSQHQIGPNKLDFSKDEDQPAKKKETKPEEGEPENEEDVSTEKLDSLGIRSRKDLVRSLKKSSFQAIKSSSLMKKKQAQDAKKQKKQQARARNRKMKLMKKKERFKRQRQGNKGDRD